VDAGDAWSAWGDAGPDQTPPFSIQNVPIATQDVMPLPADDVSTAGQPPRRWRHRVLRPYGQRDTASRGGPAGRAPADRSRVRDSGFFHRCTAGRDTPNRCATSTTGTPARTSNTAWYRCSMRLRPTNTRPRILPHAARAVESPPMS
jgi:hypothetical protein